MCCFDSFSGVGRFGFLQVWLFVGGVNGFALWFGFSVDLTVGFGGSCGLGVLVIT